MRRGLRVFAILGVLMMSLGLGQVTAQLDTSGALNIHVWLCPEGVDPTVDSSTCTTPGDLPAEAWIDNGVQGTPPTPLGTTFASDAGLDTIANTAVHDEAGLYVLSDVATNSDLHLSRFAPTEHNNFLIEGADLMVDFPYTYQLRLESNETRDINVYYYNGDQPLADPAEATITISFFECVAGADPMVAPEDCQIMQSAPESVTLDPRWDPNAPSGSLINFSQDEMSTYQIPAQPFSYVFLTGLDQAGYPGYLVKNAHMSVEDQERWFTSAPRGGQAGIAVYFTNDDQYATEHDGGFNQSSEVPVSTETSGEAQATTTLEPGFGILEIHFIGCPDGVDPNVDPSGCTTPLELPATAGIEEYRDWDHATLSPIHATSTGDGIYIIDGIAVGGYSLTGLESMEGYASYTVTGLYSDGMHTYVDIQDGQTTVLMVYYYNP